MIIINKYIVDADTETIGTSVRQDPDSGSEYETDLSVTTEETSTTETSDTETDTYDTPRGE